MDVNESIKYLEEHLRTCRDIGQMLQKESMGLYNETQNEKTYVAIETLIKAVRMIGVIHDVEVDKCAFNVGHVIEKTEPEIDEETWNKMLEDM